MEIKDVIVIARSSASDAAKDSPRLEAGLRRLLQMGRKPIVVIGPGGDQFLENCPAIEDCELAFEGEIKTDALSAIELGLLAGSGAAIVVPLNTLENGLGRLAEFDRLAGEKYQSDIIVVGADHEGQSQVNAQAWIVTLGGSKKLRTVPGKSPRPPRLPAKAPEVVWAWCA